MSKFELKKEARRLRERGFTINEIKDKLNISKSTTSYWCRDIVLSNSKYLKNKKKQILKTQKGRLLGAKINKERKLKAILDAENLAIKKIGKISKRDLLIIGTALYWSEGSKSEYTSGFVFVNSDPDMIFLMKLFLINMMGVNNNEIVCSIQINRIHEKRIKKVLSFWKKLLQLKDNQFRKPYFINTENKKIYENYENYYGICRLIVKKSTNLKYIMLGLIKAFKNDIMSV